MTEHVRPPLALSRRGFVGLGVGAFAVAALPVAAWRRPHVVRRSMPVMGTLADVVVVSRYDAIAQRAIEAAFAELRRVEALMTRFDASSDIGRANAVRAGDAVPVTGETAQVLDEALRWAELSDGAYDPALGAAIELWDVTRRTEPPGGELVARLARRGFHRQLEVGSFRGGAAIVRHAEDARVDLGGIAKGFGVDRAVGVLRDHGITNAVIDVGGDLYALGTGPDGDGWRVGIQSPHSARDLEGVFRVSDAAVATSGTYAQYFVHQGRRYHHLLDPSSASPRATLVRSLTIRADSCMHADVAATACYGESRERITARLARSATRATLVHML